MIKKCYKKAEANIIWLSNEDIIRTSGGNLGWGADGDGPPGGGSGHIPPGQIDNPGHGNGGNNGHGNGNGRH